LGEDGGQRGEGTTKIFVEVFALGSWFRGGGGTALALAIL